MSVSDENYPTIDVESFCKLIEESGRVEPVIVIGTTLTYTEIRSGKRHIIKNNQELRFNRATGIAFQLKFFGRLIDWYKQNKGWNEG